MKGIIAAILAIGSVAALGSGPYLPSGWRPEGPAFYLPTETQRKPADNPVKVTIFQENEASGSDSLREYGPPKLQEVTNNFGNQGLPDIFSEQKFQTVDVTSDQKVEAEQNLISEVITKEEPAVVIIVAATESNIVAEEKTVVDSEPEKDVTVTEKDIFEDVAVTQTTSSEDIPDTQSTVAAENTAPVVSESEFEGKSLDVNIQTDFEETTPISTNAEEISQATLQEVEATDKVIELEQGNEETVISTELNVEVKQSEVTTPLTVVENSIVETGVEKGINAENTFEEKTEHLDNVEEKLVAEVITDLKEIKNDAVVGVHNIADALVKLENEIRAEQVFTEVTAVTENSGSLEQAPEGFLEYGPPGFKEYGPPKGSSDLLNVLDQDITAASGVATNELRRRRFSPKFRSTKKNH